MTNNIGFDPELVLVLRGGWDAWLQAGGAVASGETLEDMTASDISSLDVSASPLVVTIDSLSTCQSG
jgi:3-mercaptopyruvate sulfurtransferase SseA